MIVARSSGVVCATDRSIVARIALLQLAALFFELGQRQSLVRCNSLGIEKDDVLHLRDTRQAAPSIR